MNFLGFDVQNNFSFIIKNYYAYNYEYFNMQMHSHINAEIMYAENGNCEIFVGEESKKLRLSKKQFIVINSGVKHRLIVKKNSPCKILNIELQPISESQNIDFAQILRCSKELFSVYSSYSDYFICSDSTSIENIIKNLHYELTAKSYNLAANFNIQSLILQLIIGIARCYQNDTESDIYCIKKTLDYIKSEFCNNLTINDIASFVGLNPIYLERQIKKHTNKTILQHINQNKIEKAKKLIENTTLPLTDIAFDCGFNNRQNFYSTFNKLENCSPTEYRQKITKAISNNYKQSAFTE